MNKPFPVMMFEIAKGAVTGTKPDFPETTVIER